MHEEANIYYHPYPNPDMGQKATCLAAYDILDIHEDQYYKRIIMMEKKMVSKLLSHIPHLISTILLRCSVAGLLLLLLDGATYLYLAPIKNVINLQILMIFVKREELG